MARRPNLTEAERAEIIRLRRENPNRTLAEIGARFKVSASAVCTVITKANRPAEPIKPVRMAIPPARSPHMSWVPDPKRLMAGR